MANETSVEANDQKNTATEAKAKYSYTGTNGKVLEWGHELKERERSGDIGMRQVIIRFEVGELAQFKEKYKSQATGRQQAEFDIKKALGIDIAKSVKKVVVKADKTPSAPVNEQLLGYVKKKRGEGVSYDDIRAKLESTGWTKEVIDAHFLAVGDGSDIPKPEPTIPED